MVIEFFFVQLASVFFITYRGGWVTVALLRGECPHACRLLRIYLLYSLFEALIKNCLYYAQLLQACVPVTWLQVHTHLRQFLHFRHYILTLTTT